MTEEDYKCVNALLSLIDGCTSSLSAEDKVNYEQWRGGLDLVLKVILARSDKVLHVIHDAPVRPKGKTVDRIVAFMTTANKPMTIREIAEGTDRSTASIRMHLNDPRFRKVGHMRPRDGWAYELVPQKEDQSDESRTPVPAGSAPEDTDGAGDKGVHDSGD